MFGRSVLKHVCGVVHKQFRMSPVPNHIENAPKQNTAQKNLDLEINRIVWIDMEMTGLDLEKDRIMEVACLITDSSLNILAEGPDLIIQQPEELLNGMTEWCKTQHGKSGLTEACFKSNVTIEQAEKSLMDFLFENITEKASPVAGNSVYMDRLFLQRYMPEVHNYLHYRLIDVSTVKELCRRWNSEVFKSAPKKQFNHRALDDIRESIEELKFYKNNFFKVI